MWPFKPSFHAALNREVRRFHVKRTPADLEMMRLGSEDVGERLSVETCDKHGFYSTSASLLGKTVALLLVDAEWAGADSLKFRYGDNGMEMTVCGRSYEIQPPLPPAVFEIVRALATASKLRSGRPGCLNLRFSDGAIALNVTHYLCGQHSHLEITGFTSDQEKVARARAMIEEEDRLSPPAEPAPDEQ